MSLRKPPTRTDAFLAAHRQNALKSTGPRTAAGKARVRLNGLKHGCRSPLYRLVRRLLLTEGRDPDWVERSVLGPEQAGHQRFAALLATTRRLREERVQEKKEFFFDLFSTTKPGKPIRIIKVLKETGTLQILNDLGFFAHLHENIIVECIEALSLEVDGYLPENKGVE